MAKRAPSKKSAASLGAGTRVLLLTGPEEMLKRQCMEELRAALRQAHGDLHEVMFDGKTVQLAEVLDELRTFSMLQQYKLVIVDDADQFLKESKDDEEAARPAKPMRGKRDAGGGARAAIERYTESPVDNATLVLRSEKWNAGKLDKLIEKVGAKIKCDHLSADAAQRWVIERSASAHQRRIEPRAAEVLVQRLGTSLVGLDTELSKLALLVEPNEAITAKLIEQVTGRGGDEAPYVIQDAMLDALLSGGRGDVTPGGAAIERIHELVEVSGQPKEVVAYFVADLMRKLVLASMYKRQGMPDYEIGREIKAWGGRDRAIMNLLRKLGPGGAARAFDRVIAGDARSKSGLGDTFSNLERFCIELADELQR